MSEKKFTTENLTASDGVLRAFACVSLAQNYLSEHLKTASDKVTLEMTPYGDKRQIHFRANEGDHLSQGFLNAANPEFDIYPHDVIVANTINFIASDKDQKFNVEKTAYQVTITRSL